MDWWSLFRRVRRIIFAFIAIASLVWSVILSLYLSKEWPHSSVLQRAIVLALIGVNALTSLLLYLMIVVVFRMWKELLRMLFLLAIHIAPAVLFTLNGFTFSCGIFDSLNTCQLVEHIFLASTWSITGLLLGYTVYLCIMSRVPRPFPLIMPNDLLAVAPRNRPRSTSSMRSTTGLLSKPDLQPPMRSASPASVYSYRSGGARTVSKKQFVASTGGQSTQSTVRANGDGTLRRNPSNGASSPLYSRFSMSTVGSVEDDSPMSPLKKLMNLRTPNHSRNISASSLPRITQQQPPPPKQQPRPLLLNPNPFKDPLSRHGTPETAFSGSTFMSGSGSVGVARMAPGPFVHRGLTNPFVQYTGIPAQAHRPPGSQTNRLGTPQMYARAHVYPGAPCADYAGMPERAHSATPSASSIHSMAPSIHFTDASGNTYVHPAALTPSHPSNGNDPHAAARLPATAHLRSASDPYVRSYSAEPRIRLHGADDDVVLPNPYAGGAEIRRYGSVPHVRSGGFVGFGPQGVAHVDSPGSRVQMRDIEHGPRAPGDNSWMETVLRAAWQR